MASGEPQAVVSAKSKQSENQDENLVDFRKYYSNILHLKLVYIAPGFQLNAARANNNLKLAFTNFANNACPPGSLIWAQFYRWRAAPLLLAQYSFRYSFGHSLKHLDIHLSIRHPDIRLVSRLIHFLRTKSLLDPDSIQISFGIRLRFIVHLIHSMNFMTCSMNIIHWIRSVVRIGCHKIAFKSHVIFKSFRLQTISRNPNLESQLIQTKWFTVNSSWFTIRKRENWGQRN